MNRPLSFSSFAARLRGLIAQSPSEFLQDKAFNDLALELYCLQFESVGAYRQLCEKRRCLPGQIAHWSQIPALPSSSFKEHALSSLTENERAHVFFSSGTTQQARSRHFHDAESLSIYEASLVPWFERHVLPDIAKSRIRMVILTPCATEAPHSSLVHMFEAARDRWGNSESMFAGKSESDGSWTLETSQTLDALQKAVANQQSVALLGTAFSFVHLLDCVSAAGIHLALPKGSRALETGGYKGRSRVLSKTELHGSIIKTFGIPDSHVISEYGMSELSSQAYDRAIPSATSLQGARVFQFPPWARAQVVSPENGREVSDGEMGLARVFDLANVRSVLALQTEDLAIRRGAGFELIGRAPQAEPRGCSLMSA